MKLVRAVWMPPSVPAISGQADGVAIAVRLEDIGRPRRTHAVAHHRRAVAMDDGERQPGLVVLPRYDSVDPILGEEGGPVLQPVVVDGMGVGRV